MHIQWWNSKERRDFHIAVEFVQLISLGTDIKFIFISSYFHSVNMTPFVLLLKYKFLPVKLSDIFQGTQELYIY